MKLPKLSAALGCSIGLPLLILSLAFIPMISIGYIDYQNPQEVLNQKILFYCGIIVAIMSFLLITYSLVKGFFEFRTNINKKNEK